jgi:hypothetical protein
MCHCKKKILNIILKIKNFKFYLKKNEKKMGFEGLGPGLVASHHHTLGVASGHPQPISFIFFLKKIEN